MDLKSAKTPTKFDGRYVTGFHYLFRAGYVGTLLKTVKFSALYICIIKEYIYTSTVG